VDLPIALARLLEMNFRVSMELSAYLTRQANAMAPAFRVAHPVASA
jgi:hypothetical protein